MITIDTDNRELTEFVKPIKDVNAIRDGLKVLLEDGKILGREEVYKEIRGAFKEGIFIHNRLYFDDAEDLIQLIKIRLKDKQ